MVQIKTLLTSVKLKSPIQSPFTRQRENCFGSNIQNISLYQLACHRPWRQFRATLLTFSSRLPLAVKTVSTSIYSAHGKYYLTLSRNLRVGVVLVGQNLPEVVQIKSPLTRFNRSSFISVSLHHTALRRFWINSSKNRYV